MDLYRTLGVARDARPADIAAAYRKKVATLHPDSGGDPYSWRAIQQAYDTLIDEQSRAEYDGYEDDYAEEEQEEEDGTSVFEEPWYRKLEAFDLFAALGVHRVADGTIIGGGTRCRAQFYKLSTRTRPLAPERYIGVEEYAADVVRYRQTCLAFLTLRDPAKYAIYRDMGYERLRAAESYQEDSVFEQDPDKVVRDFFDGVNAADREFLLANGQDAADDGFDGEQRLRRVGLKPWGGEAEAEEEEAAEEEAAEDDGENEVEEDEGDEDEDEDEDDEDDIVVLAAAARELDEERRVERARASKRLSPSVQAHQLRDLPPPPPPVGSSAYALWKSAMEEERRERAAAEARAATALETARAKKAFLSAKRTRLLQGAARTDMGREARRAARRTRTTVWWRRFPFARRIHR